MIGPATLGPWFGLWDINSSTPLPRPPFPRPVTASLGCYGPQLGPIHGSPRHPAVHLRITMAAESVFRMARTDP